MNVSRRRFVFVGLAGAAVLAGARWLVPNAAVGGPAATGLTADAADILRALVPALLDGALPDDIADRDAAITRTVAAVGTAIDGLPPATREELATLFALLASMPVRIFVAGMGGAWRGTTVADANGFLVRLQKSRWSVKRSAYDALHQLTFAAWYADPRTWPAIGYPGPPALA
ncbi:MAG TPA: hypothetical protein VJV77_11685 [Casimicrobiaceae bacterium]|nr:hypothetical protein [Casimicrobiaceae bacterium]